MEKTTWALLSLSEQELLTHAEQVMAFAYSPYSTFCVGAALLALDGSIHIGTNMENATHTETIHAEMAALTVANTRGIRQFSTLAVIGKPREGMSREPVMPCGICRQLLHEFAQLGSGDIQILASNTKKDTIIRTSLNELLPQAFGPKDLNIDLSLYR
ncbi:cytidine deaminase [Patescibacteria group bacterium]|nr:cytidine deaminase [Patescibacteria group bacterium]MBP9710380.1 cytidine deaminase [Patescibacteria group bacterium]